MYLYIYIIYIYIYIYNIQLYTICVAYWGVHFFQIVWGLVAARIYIYAAFFSVLELNWIEKNFICRQAHNIYAYKITLFLII